MSSALLQLETEIKDRLEALPFFADLTILVEPRKNIVAEINARLAKLRTLIAPKVTGADDNHTGLTGAYFDKIRISVGVFQNPLLKGDDAEVWEVAEELVKALKGWKPDSLSNALNPATPTIEPVADERLNICSVNFETLGGFLGALDSVAIPTVTGAGDYTFACATPGAAIFYTTNGSNPTPRSSLATGVQTLGSGLTVKARAFLAGYHNSPLLKFTTA